jgi:hypothetical protein
MKRKETVKKVTGEKAAFYPGMLAAKKHKKHKVAIFPLFFRVFRVFRGLIPTIVN